MARIFLDNAATTPLDSQVMERMIEAMRELNGNPSSIHAEGRKARTAIEQARKTVADTINASIGEIFFTSGGTEANNMAIKNAVRDLGVRRIISSPIEHHCVLHSVEAVARDQDVSVEWVQLDACGRPDLNDLRNRLARSEEKTLISLMHSNNEIGTILDTEAVAAMCQEFGALFHCDTVQTLGYFPIDVKATPIHFLSGSAHKFYGPKGVGFIYINGDKQLKPYLDGGAQERNMRGGTENLYGIVGLAAALRLQHEQMEQRAAHIRAVQKHFRQQLSSAIPDVRFHGDPETGHYKVLSVSFPPSDKSDLLLLSLDIAGISASGGSACSSGVDTGSHVVQQLEPNSPRATIRFSFSHHNTTEELDRVIAELVKILEPKTAMNSDQ